MLSTQVNNVSQPDKMAGLVPLSRVAAAAIIDTYADKGKAYELNMHWAARSYHELMEQYLGLKSKLVKRRIILNVSKNTHNAVMPCDVENLLFVAGICDGKKYPLSQDGSLINPETTEFQEDKCSACGQSKNICNELQVTETINAVTINDTVYDETVVKKLYPNGDYYLETTTPYWDLQDEVIAYHTDKKFVTNLDLQPCGCLSTTAENLQTLQIYCPDTFYCYYASCERPTGRLGGYNFFEESGLLQLDYGYRYDKVYIEYNSFLKKMNGQWYVPKVAFEMLVEMTKFKSVRGKTNIPRFEKEWQKEQMRDARNNMERIIFRFNLSTLRELIHELPKFSINDNWYSCYRKNQTLTASTTSTTCDTPVSTTESSTSAGSVITITREIAFEKRVFKVLDINTPMVTGDTSWIIKDDGGVLPEKNIIDNSVNIVFNGQPLEPNQTDQISYTVAYGAGQTAVTFTNLVDGVLNGDKISFSYARKV